MSGEDQQSWLIKFDADEESVMGEQVVPDSLEVETLVSTSAEVCKIDNTIPYKRKFTQFTVGMFIL